MVGADESVVSVVPELPLVIVPLPPAVPSVQTIHYHSLCHTCIGKTLRKLYKICSRNKLPRGRTCGPQKEKAIQNEKITY
jgi:hypothetical protein